MSFRLAYDYRSRGRTLRLRRELAGRGGRLRSDIPLTTSARRARPGTVTLRVLRPPGRWAPVRVRARR